MDKTWFITGISSGLGRELTEQLLARGDRVIGTVRRGAGSICTAQQASGQLQVLTLDLTDRAGVRSTVDEAFRRAARIDVVVSNAAYGLVGEAEALDDEQIDRQIATNLTGSIALIRAVLPHLRRQQGGRIVQVSSEGGQIAYPCFSLYHATKWGIEGFVESVAQEVAPFGIDFLIVEPGPTGTRFAQNKVMAGAMDAYRDTPAGALRRALDEGRFELRGDARRTVQAMIVAAESNPMPLRLALGSTAHQSISAALARRLAAIDAQRELAYSADRDPASEVAHR